jgi:RNA-binding protein YhbY
VKHLKASCENIHSVQKLAHSHIERALQKALEKQSPKATLKQIDTAQKPGLDSVLDISGKRVGLEIKATNFYDALGRATLWENELDGIYLIVPSQILPSREILSRIPAAIGVVTYQIKDRKIRFEVIKQSKGQHLPEFAGQIQLETPPPKSTKKPKTSLVSPKALQVIKYLISQRETTQIQVARETNVSTGMVNKVISALVDRDLVSYRGKRLVVFDIWKLLNEVSWNRPLKSLKKGEIRLIDTKSTEEVEAKLAETCDQAKMRYALTLFSGASKYIGYGMRYDSVQAYVEDPSAVLERLNQTRPGTGEAVTLEIFAVDNWDIIEEAKVVNGHVVCSPTQLILDLVSHGGVGRDWAVKLYEATIAKKEQKNAHLRS